MSSKVFAAAQVSSNCTLDGDGLTIHFGFIRVDNFEGEIFGLNPDIPVVVPNSMLLASKNKIDHFVRQALADRIAVPDSVNQDPPYPGYQVDPEDIFVFPSLS